MKGRVDHSLSLPSIEIGPIDISSRTACAISVVDGRAIFRRRRFLLDLDTGYGKSSRPDRLLISLSGVTVLGGGDGSSVKRRGCKAGLADILDFSNCS